MKYSEWLEYLHPHTRGTYERSIVLQYGTNKPDFIVFIDTIRRDSDKAREITRWLDDNVGWREWYLVDVANGSLMNIIGFDEEHLDIAAEFKLRYGSGYHPSMGNVN